MNKKTFIFPVNHFHQSRIMYAILTIIITKEVLNQMGIIGWIIIGALSGWIASMVTGNNEEMGAGKNIVVGIIGAFIGGFVMNIVGGVGVTGFNLWSLVVSIVGAIILLLIVNAFTHQREKD